MAITGVNNQDPPVFSARKLKKRRNCKPNCSKKGSGAGDPPPPDDRGPPYNHFTFFCPAGSQGCSLYECNIHGCVCKLVLGMSLVVLVLVLSCFLFIFKKAADDNFGIANSHACSYSDEMSVSHIISRHKPSEELQRQLKLLQHGQSGTCKWKESKQCVGLPNLAAQELGASIVTTYNTVPYGKKYCQFQNSQEYCDSSCPNNILKYDVVPGRNFNFEGMGEVLIRLGGPAVISGFTLHHPPKEFLPSGFNSAAPNEFEVWGLKSISEDNSTDTRFGKYKYEISSSPAQAFPIKKYLRDKISLIKLKVLSNHGHKNYTAVYRFEVHGDIN